jgi:hypothetical protein
MHILHFDQINPSTALSPSPPALSLLLPPSSPSSSPSSSLYFLATFFGFSYAIFISDTMPVSISVLFISIILFPSPNHVRERERETT